MCGAGGGRFGFAFRLRSAPLPPVSSFPSSSPSSNEALIFLQMSANACSLSPIDCIVEIGFSMSFKACSLTKSFRSLEPKSAGPNAIHRTRSAPASRAARSSFSSSLMMNVEARKSGLMSRIARRDWSIAPRISSYHLSPGLICRSTQILTPDRSSGERWTRKRSNKSWSSWA
jgi:hypothetical protein